MFWAGIPEHYTTDLVECDGIMNSEKYIRSILEEIKAPLQNNDKDLIFQQDNAPCHTSKVVKRWLEEKKNQTN